MEKQESQFIDGTKFNKKDAFRESWSLFFLLSAAVEVRITHN